MVHGTGRLSLTTPSPVLLDTCTGAGGVTGTRLVSDAGGVTGTGGVTGAGGGPLSVVSVSETGATTLASARQF